MPASSFASRSWPWLGGLFRRGKLQKMSSGAGKVLWVLFLRFGGPPALLTMLTLPVYGKYGEVFHVLPRVDVLSPWQKLLVSLFDAYLLLAGLYCTSFAAFVDPGFAPKWDEERAADSAELGSPAASQCEKCNSRRGPRTHHCSVCKRCVDRMDHHCILVNNCVGARNYRHFLLAVLHLWTGTLVFLLLCLLAAPPATTASSPTAAPSESGLWNPFSVLWEAVGPPEGLRGLPFRAEMCWRNAYFCYGLTTYLLLVHGQLVLANETSIEAAVNHKLRRAGQAPKRSFDLGWRANFQQVFGPTEPWALRWLLPCPPPQRKEPALAV